MKAQKSLFSFYAKKFFKLYDDVMTLDRPFMRDDVAQLRVGKQDRRLHEMMTANAVIAGLMKEYSDIA